MKKLLFFVTLLAAALLTPSIAHSGTFGRYGVGVFGSASHHNAETKVFSLGYSSEAISPFVEQYEFGLYTDSVEGRRSSGFGNYALGIEVTPGYMIARSMWGAGFITSPDSMLGGWFQFNQDLLLGVKDSRGRIIGLNYKHISSAGIYQPNQGRDFLVVHVEIPW